MLRDLHACGGCGKQTVCALLDAGAEFPQPQGVEIRQQEFCADAPIDVDGDCLLAVKSGVVKSVCRDAQGNTRVLAFSFAGDLFGLEAMTDAAHGELRHGAAVSMTTVCRMRLSPDAARRASPHFCDRLSAELAARLRDNFAHRQIVAAAAPVRMAHWLMQCLRAAQAQRGARCLSLPAIARADMASYLHLRAETVSRILSEFRRKGWVRGPLHRLEVCDAEALAHLARGTGVKSGCASHQEAMHG
ncbi:MAG: Crp/Fnr family transcriptional regulator [Thiomonas sp.]